MISLLLLYLFIHLLMSICARSMVAPQYTVYTYCFIVWMMITVIIEVHDVRRFTILNILLPIFLALDFAYSVSVIPNVFRVCVFYWPDQFNIHE